VQREKEDKMAQINFKGDPVHTIGELPKVGDKAPDFLLTKNDLSDISLKDVSGKKVILNIFPSIYTPDTGEALDTCVQTSTAEHARADDIDEPCDDGRAG